MSTDIRAALERLVQHIDDPIRTPFTRDETIAAARAALAQPAGEGPSAAEIDAAWLATWKPEANCYDVAAFARAILARWGHPTAPPAPEVWDGPSLADVVKLCQEFFHIADPSNPAFAIVHEMITAAITRWPAPGAQPGEVE